jgi:hypothetical protein
VPAPKRVNPQNEERNEEVEGGVATLSSVTAGPAVPEVEVDPIVAEAPQQSGVRTVVIRVNDNVEEMSYIANGRKERYTFEAGNRYRVPIYIAAELEGLGKIWH